MGDAGARTVFKETESESSSETSPSKKKKKKKEGSDYVEETDPPSSSYPTTDVEKTGDLNRSSHYIVADQMLELLLEQFCKTCPQCREDIGNRKTTHVGMALVVTWTCNQGHKTKWYSQVMDVVKQRSPLSHTQAAVATVCSGKTHQAFADFMEILGCRYFSHTTYDRIQSKYVQNAVRDAWDDHRSEILEDLKKKDSVRVAADAQFDSPGYCATLCSEQFLDADSGLILNTEVVHKMDPDVGGFSGKMELVGARRGLKKLKKSEGLNITHCVTGKL